MRRSGNGMFVGFVAATVALILSLALSLYNLNLLVTTADDLARADDARELIGVLVDAVTDAETGQRGYLLTGSGNYLQPFHVGRSNAIEASRGIPGALQGVGISADAPAVRGLLLAVELKLGELSDTLDTFDDDGGRAALNQVSSGVGLELMEEIRTRARDVRMMVEQRIAELTHRSDSARRFATLSTFATAFLTIVTIGVAFLNADRQTILRRLAMERTHSLSRQLNALTEVAPRIGSTRDRASLLGLIVNESRRILGVEIAGIRIIQGSAHDAVAVGSLGRALQHWSLVESPLAIGLQAEAEGTLVGIEGPVGTGEFHGPEDIHTALAAPLTDRAGHVIGHLLVAEPTTGTLDAANRSSLVQLAQIVSAAWESVQLLEELQQTAEEREHFMAMLGHELRNPLNAITGAAQVLSRTLDPGAPTAELVSMLDRQSAFMRRMIDELLEVARLEHGKIELRPTTVDLGEILRTVTDDFRTGTGQPLNVEIPATQTLVEGDPDRLAQCVNNLLDNARKFGEGKPIHARLQAEGGKAILEITDFGVGIPAHKLSSVFGRYVQGEHGRRDGLGLGLTLVAGLIELHRGNVTVHSQGTDAGTTFRIELPLTERPMDAPVDEAPVPAPRRILVVDDRADARLALQTLLVGDGHMVEVAPSGSIALQRLRHAAFEVVFCDIHMDDELDGYAVARAIRADERTADLKLFALTGFGSHVARERSRDAGFDEHLTKPVDLQQIRRVLNAHVG